MMWKILLNTLFFSYLFFPVQSDNFGIVPTLDDQNRVNYQLAEHYLPVVSDKYKLPHKSGESLGIKTTADSVVIIDEASGHILFRKNPGRAHAMASLVKLMTAYVFLEQDYNFDQVVTISLEAKHDPEESTLNVKKGEAVTVYDLFLSSLIGSANNATREMVAALGYSEPDFVQLMNQQAKEWGMNQTNFVDVTGISPNNKSTVADYIKLVRLAFANEKINQATIKKEHRFRSVSGNEHQIKNSNRLLDSDLKILGSKTGFTYEAGYCLALKVEGNKKQAIDILLLGSLSSSDRFAEAKNLANWVFSNYQWD